MKGGGAWGSSTAHIPRLTTQCGRVLLGAPGFFPPLPTEPSASAASDAALQDLRIDLE